MKQLLGPALLLFMLISNVSVCQDLLTVVTRTVEKTVDISATDTLIINAEKAHVHIKTWQKQSVGLKIQLISKHKQKRIAEEELSFLKYTIEKKPLAAVISNFFQAEGNFKRVSGSLSVNYQIYVPETCLVKVNNNYGSVEVIDLKNNLDVVGKFLDVTLQDLEGRLALETFYGTNSITHSSGRMIGDLQKSNTRILQYEGDINIQANYGTLKVDTDKPYNVEANCSGTEISFSSSNLTKYNYDLNTKFSKVQLPELILEMNKDIDNSYQKTFDPENPTIKLYTTYSPIELNQQYNALNK